MTSHAAQSPSRGLPSVPVQVLRASVATLTAAAVLAALGWAAMSSGPWASERWASLVGDPSISLAAGVTLSDVPARTVAVSVDPSVIGLGTSTEALERAFGGPVRELSTPAQVAAANGPEGLDAEAMRGVRYFATAAGVARFLHEDAGVAMVPAVVFTGGAHAPTARTAQEREAVLRRLVDALGWTAGSASSRVGLVVAEQSRGDAIVVSADVRAGGDSVMSSLFGPDQARFDVAGRLTSAIVWVAPVVEVHQADVVSAAAAFDDLRHHRADVGGAWIPMSVEQAKVAAGVRLVGSDMAVPASWVMLSDSQWLPVIPLAPGS